MTVSALAARGSVLSRMADFRKASSSSSLAGVIPADAQHHTGTRGGARQRESCSTQEQQC